MPLVCVPDSIKKHRGGWCAIAVIFALTVAVMWLATHTSSVRATPPQNPLSQMLPPGACPQTQKYEIENTSTYTGVWDFGAGEPGDSNGQLSFSTDIGATATFTFTGISLDLIVRTEPLGGQANVLVDGSLGPFTVDFYSSKQYQVLRPITVGLSSGVHTVEITVASNPLFPTRREVLLDAYLVGDPSLGPADSYEPDNDVFNATSVSFNTYMTGRILDSDSDQDWISFDVQAGEVFTITTYNLFNLTPPGEGKTDTVLTLYDTDGSTELVKSDDISWPSDLSSQIVYTATTSGTYYAMVAPYPNTSGCWTSYDLSLVKEWKTYLPIILKSYPAPAPTATPTNTPIPTDTPTPGPSPTPTKPSPLVPTPPPAPCYPVKETPITVGSDPRGVAYNSDDNLIYVANYGDNTVSVISGATYGVVATINGVAGAHGVAYDSEHSLVYVTQRDSAQLAVIDASTNTVSLTIPVGNQPHGVAYNPTSHKVYVANYADDTVTIIDANTMSALTTVPTGDEPAHVTVNTNPFSNKVYVSNHGSGTVTVINGTTNGVVTTVSLGSSGPYGIAADTWRNLIYVVSIEVVNIDTPNLVTIDGATDQVKSNMWGHVSIHKTDDSLVPLRVMAVNPYLGPSPGGGHLYITSSSGDIAGDYSHGTDQLLMIRKGWPEGFNKPNPLDVRSRPEEGIAVDLANSRVFVTARDVNLLTVIRDTGDHSQLCSEAFVLDGYVIEPVP